MIGSIAATSMADVACNSLMLGERTAEEIKMAIDRRHVDDQLTGARKDRQACPVHQVPRPDLAASCSRHS